MPGQDCGRIAAESTVKQTKCLECDEQPAIVSAEPGRIRCSLNRSPLELSNKRRVSCACRASSEPCAADDMNLDSV
jgi:hypothetical protein